MEFTQQDHKLNAYTGYMEIEVTEDGLPDNLIKLIIHKKIELVKDPVIIIADGMPVLNEEGVTIFNHNPKRKEEDTIFLRYEWIIIIWDGNHEKLWENFDAPFMGTPEEKFPPIP